MIRWKRSGINPGTHKEAVADEAEDDGRGTSQSLIPYCSMVGKVRGTPARVVGVSDPHLLSEYGLHDEGDRDHGEEAIAHPEESSIAILAGNVVPFSTAKYECNTRKVQDKLDACT